MARKRRVRNAETKQLDKGEEEEHTIKSYILQQLNKFFIQHLPMDSLHELPPDYMYYVGTVAYMAMIATFVYFTFQSYTGSMQQAFIALDPGSGDCSSVSIAITGTYYADNKGNWVGTPDYQYSESPYSISLNNFQVNSFGEYQTMMTTFNDALHHIGSLSLNHSLAYNLIVWSSWIRYYSTLNPSTTNFTSQGLGQLQYIQMTGQPAVIFNANRHQAVISSQHGLCPVTGYTSYDLANAMLTAQLNYTQFRAQYICLAALEPQLFGYAGAVDDSYFLYSLDVNAFSTAMAVNYGILRLEDLGVASSSVYIFQFNGVSYKGQQYFDLRYPYMAPIFCIRNISALPAANLITQNLCFLLQGEAVMLPLFHHYGVSNRYPVPCRCGEAYKNVGETLPCQVFNLLASVIFFLPTRAPTLEAIILQQIADLLYIVDGHSSYSEFNWEGFNASWSAAANAYGHKAAETLTPTWQTEAFGFCTTAKGQKCSMATFNVYNAINRIVSEYKFNLANGSCHNSFTIPDDKWLKLEENAPVQLTQNYYDCYPSAYSAFLNALGIASGNTQLVVPFTVLGTLPLIYIFLVLLNRVPPKEEYTPLEKDEVMEIVSIILLRLRDGKTRGFKKHGILVNLTKELIKAAKEEVGYPDSDDDNEDENYQHDEDDEDSDEDDEEESNDSDDDDNYPNGNSNHKSNNATSRSSNVNTTIDSDDEEEAVRANNNNNNQIPVAKQIPSKTKGSNNDNDLSNKRKKKKQRRQSVPINYDTWQDNNGTTLKLKKASKMSVFTRHLEEENNYNAPTQQRRRTGVFNDNNNGANNSADSSYYPGKYLINAVRTARQLQQEANSNNHNNNNDNNADNGSRRKKNKKNYSKHTKNVRESEMGQELIALQRSPIHNSSSSSGGSNRRRSAADNSAKLVFRIIAHEGIPTGCVILNALDREQVQNISKKPITDLKQLSQLVDDLSKQANATFTDFDANPRPYEATEDLHRPDSLLFQLTALSMRLLFVDFEFFLLLGVPNNSKNDNREELAMIFLKLSNTMRLQASVLLQMSLRDIETLLPRKVGYNVGGRWVTSPHLVQMMQQVISENDV